MTFYIVRCSDGSYTVVSILGMVPLVRDRQTELYTFEEAHAFAEKYAGCMLRELDAAFHEEQGDYRTLVPR